MGNAVYSRVESRLLRFSNLEKVFFPETGFTKRDVIKYYREIAPTLLPYIRNRALTLKRYPDGVEGPHFYEKHCPTHRPSWIETSRMDDVPYCLANDLPSLLWAVNLGSIEVHPLLSVAPNWEIATTLVFDLDPGAPAGLGECAEVALLVRDLLGMNGLDCFAKTSGSKGLQVYVPLGKGQPFDQTKTFARAVAEALELQRPKLIVSRMTKRYRTGKVFIDWSQNDRHKTTVAPYSLRAKRTPTISTPVTWREVEDGSLNYEVADVLARVRKISDPFAPVLKLKQTLPRRLLVRTAA